MSIKSKLLVLAASALAAILALGSIMYYSLTRVTYEMMHVTEWWMEGIQESNLVISNAARYRAFEYEYALTQAPGAKREMETCLTTIRQTLDHYAEPEDLSLPVGADLDPQDFMLYNTVVSALEAYLSGNQAAILQAEQGRAPEETFRAITGSDADSRFLALYNAASVLSDYNYQGSMNSAAAAKNLANRMILLSVVLIGVALVLLALVAALIIRSITRPIAGLIRASSQIAGGDLAHEIMIDAKAELGTLAANFKALSDNLNNVMSEIVGVSNRVGNSAREVASTSNMIAQGSTTQASSIEEISASLSDIEGKVRANSQTAATCNTFADNVISDAEDGSSKMEMMVQAMRDISEASKNIANIIKVIDDIAFKTNILALNAAVEAARAGQHGRGFAVVAEEVRNLAAQSANAVKDTAGMINDTMNKVNHGTDIAGETSDALMRIVEGVRKASDLISSISESSVEETSAISQITSAVEQMAQTVQISAATTQETAALSSQLSDEASALRDLTHTFTLREELAAAVPALPAIGGGQNRLGGGGSASGENRRQTYRLPK
ncbi:MAG: methyl-accepting chemotaxis protein [Clostridiales bacterium]|jgi:methyl-accepting chemotaxis protein|nr:methyl-accepting chemotaxis protein [Clostridiales bacterium]